ncbi:MAG: hypothetical protein VW268_01505 [Rhodospirillaceae bacterium]
MQDLGFKSDETDVGAGVVSGSKGSGRGRGWWVGTDIRVTVTTKPASEQSTVVRATFQKIHAGHDGRFTYTEPVIDPKISQDFYNKLSQSLFLEARQI